MRSLLLSLWNRLVYLKHPIRIGWLSFIALGSFSIRVHSTSGTSPTVVRARSRTQSTSHAKTTGGPIFAEAKIRPPRLIPSSQKDVQQHPDCRRFQQIEPIAVVAARLVIVRLEIGTDVPESAVQFKSARWNDEDGASATTTFNEQGSGGYQ